MRRNLRVLMVADGLALDTGFGQVSRHAAEAFLRRGWVVGQLAMFDEPPFCDSRPYWELGVQPYFCRDRGFVGGSDWRRLCFAFDPDVVYINRDPGATARFFAEAFAPYLGAIPTVLYAPIEGAPVMQQFADVFRRATVARTYTAWASARLRQQHALVVPAIPHGVDTSVFRPAHTAAEREADRLELGWTGKYVVMYCARNAKRKAQDRLIRALVELDKVGAAEDVLLYLHTTKFAGYSEGGWDLDDLAHYAGLPHKIQFAASQDTERGESQGSLAAKYRAADVYVHVAGCEGFGLPILEALASGLPVIIPDDNANMAEVCSGAELIRIAPRDWETWFTGVQLANVHPVDIASCIQLARADPARAAAAGERGRLRAEQLPWEAMGEALADAVAEAALAAQPVVVAASG